MYIKQVTIHGFKTFADKTIIDFGQGVTSIIGPNGCGKSNIVDSVRWAFGEQSAKSLRGGEMTDVISNGNRKRKPSPFCEVAVVLDNGDQSLSLDAAEVSIRRKLFRNGDAEYFLNEKAARLKDIRELFMDTGIGAKTNTVIEQEQLTKLLQASSKERKTMIEEAAGISRFRQRRQESYLKLNRVSDNMTRLQDIVSEVEKQKRSVATQASKATRYESMQKEIRKSKLDVAIMELHGWIDERLNFEKKRESIHQVTDELKSKEKDDQKELNELDQKEQETETLMAKLQEEQASFFKSYADTENAIRENKQSIEKLERDIATIEAEIERFKGELAQANEKANEQKDLNASSSEIETLEQEIQKLKAEIKELSEKVQSKKQLISEAQNSQIELIRKKSALQNENIKIESHLEFLNRRLKQVVDKETELEQGPQTESEQELDPKLVKAQEIAEQCLAKKDEHVKKISQHRQQQKELELQLRRMVSETSGHRSRLSLLKEMEEKYEGIGSGVRNVLDVYVKDHPDETYPGGVHGVVADLVTVPENYVDAIEAALGPRMQNLVFTTAQEAKDAIFFLRKNNFGRATMLPLDRIRTRQKLEGKVLSYPGVKGEAYNLVGFDEQYKRLFSHLLHGTLVVDSLDHGLAISKEHKVRIVTLDGDLISPEGAMSGGGKNKDSGILSRKVEIEDLESKLSDTEKEQKTLMGQHEASLEREEKVERELKLVEGRIKEMEDQVKIAEQKKAVAEREALRIQQEKVVISREKENLLQQIETAKKEHQLKQDEIQLLEKDPEQVKTQEDSDDLGLLEENLNRLNAVLQERELKKVSLLERSQSAEREKEYVKEKIEELEERLERRAAIIQEKQQELENRRKKLSEDQEVFQQLENEKGQQQSQYFELKDQREAMRKRRSELQKSAISTADQLRKEEHELTNIAVKEERLRVKQEELFNRIHSEFHTNIEDLYYSMRENEDEIFYDENEFPERIKNLNQNVNELEIKLNNLGNVNFEAIEELKGLEERENELKGQMGDLTGSFKKLDQFIKDLDKQCNDMFKETFEQVNQHFTVMFQRLFGGGEGRLLIEQDVDPLEAGITIFASPPGKSPKILSQLSGGEKVLTTIAFLFSIFLYKPSPFCILDEIDAPLDEHNVDRFMDAIRSFTDRCQFLVVTHNRRTMSLSDVIHGVTMQETGISNCMTVDMDKFNFEAQTISNN